jgi:NTP pyrophosphatase (non-canonical NTP hydrolase)
METEDIHKLKPSDWQPETSKVRLALLGKLGEEASELAGIALRCMIQGIDECEPVSGKPNRQKLEEELADVMALITQASNWLGLDMQSIMERRRKKIAFQEQWFLWLDRAGHNGDGINHNADHNGHD